MTTRLGSAAVRICAVAALVIVAAVTLNANQGTLSAAAPIGSRSWLGRILVVLPVLCSLAGLVLLGWVGRQARRRRAKGESEPELIPQWHTSRPAGLLFLCLAVAAAIGPWLLLLAGPDTGRALRESPALPSVGQHSASHQPVPGPEATNNAVLMLILGLAVCAMVALAVRRVRSSRAPGESAALLPSRSPPSGRTAMAGHPEEAVSVLDPDRARVIAAYVALRDAASERGLRPESSETPDEFLARVRLWEVRLADDTASLTELFQRARFSHEALRDGDAQSAGSALSRLLSTMRGRT